jgi:hypothetical protein
LPDEVKRKYFGPGVLALVAILTGMLNTSKRKALAMINEVFCVPMSLGGLSNCEAQLADALEQPYNETSEHIRGQDVAHADEKPAGVEVIDSEAGCGPCVAPVQPFLWFTPSEAKKRQGSCWAAFVANWSVTAGADIASSAVSDRYAGRI